MSASGWSSVARKLIMGVSGLALVGFLVAHMAGNLNLFLGEEAFNNYAVNLHKIPGFLFIEIATGLLFVIHIVTAISLIRDNRKARPVGYAVETPQARSKASLFMPISGLVVLTFLVVHLATIKFGDASKYRDGGFGLVKDVLGTPVTAVIYLAGVILLAPHLRHGIQSCFRSLGVTSKEGLEKADKVAIAVSAVLTLGFGSMPIWGLLTS